MVYRLKQFWWEWTARPLSAEQRARVASILDSAELQALYYTQSHSDQQHTLRILDLLERQPINSRALQQAALLHDIGKTRLPLTILDRVWTVIASRMMPRKSAEWGANPHPPYRHRKSAVIKQWHPEWGATMVAPYSVEPLVVTLIRKHQDKLTTNDNSDEEQLLRQLQWADDQS